MVARLKYDGDLERGVRKFSLISTYVMVFFKLFVILIFWKGVQLRLQSVRRRPERRVL